MNITAQRKNPVDEDFPYASPGVPDYVPDGVDTIRYDEDGRAYYDYDGERVYLDEHNEEKEKQKDDQDVESKKSSIGLIFTGILVVIALYQTKKMK